MLNEFLLLQERMKEVFELNEIIVKNLAVEGEVVPKRNKLAAKKRLPFTGNLQENLKTFIFND